MYHLNIFFIIFQGLFGGFFPILFVMPVEEYGIFGCFNVLVCELEPVFPYSPLYNNKRIRILYLSKKLIIIFLSAFFVKHGYLDELL